MGNLISKKKICVYCLTDCKFYYNPLLEIHSIGKRNRQLICLDCFDKKRIESLETYH